MGGDGGHDPHVLAVVDFEALLARLAVAEDERDRARGIAVALEQECAELRQALAAIATGQHTADVPTKNSGCPACGPAAYARAVLDRTGSTEPEEEDVDVQP